MQQDQDRQMQGFAAFSYFLFDCHIAPCCSQLFYAFSVYKHTYTHVKGNFPALEVRVMRVSVFRFRTEGDYLKRSSYSNVWFGGAFFARSFAGWFVGVFSSGWGVF
jgi:hypothetical protein